MANQSLLGKEQLKWALLGLTVFGLGVGMPSCPGQQAMQQQIDALQAANADLTKRVQVMGTDMQGMNEELGKVKTLLPQMTNVIQAQKTALEQLEGSVKALQAKGGQTKGGKKKK